VDVLEDNKKHFFHEEISLSVLHRWSSRVNSFMKALLAIRALSSSLKVWAGSVLGCSFIPPAEGASVLQKRQSPKAPLE